MAVLVQVDAGGCANRLLRIFLERRRERLLRPLLLGIGRVTTCFENIADWRFRQNFAVVLLLLAMSYPTGRRTLHASRCGAQGQGGRFRAGGAAYLRDRADKRDADSTHTICIDPASTFVNGQTSNQPKTSVLQRLRRISSRMRALGVACRNYMSIWRNATVSRKRMMAREI